MTKIAAPANYVGLTGMAFGAIGDDAAPVSEANPLPVALQGGDLGNDDDPPAASYAAVASLIAHMKLLNQLVSDVTTAAPVYDGGQPYEVVAVSQTNQVLGATGAMGDVLAQVWVRAGATPTDVVIKDDTTTLFTIKAAKQTANTEEMFYFGVRSLTGAWKMTTGTGSSAVCIGRFS